MWSQGDVCQVAASEKEAAELQFSRLQEAYETLSNAKKRSVFEQHGYRGLSCHLDKICAAKVS